jgi:sulfur-oxidizing protein SoxY
MSEPSPGGLSRRDALAAGAGAAALLVVRPVLATPERMTLAVRAFTGGAAARPGRILLDLPPLAESGNSVALAVSVDSPMTESDHVRRIGIFNEKNPLPTIAIFHLTARSGSATVATRIRLADSQRIHAVCEMSDGSYWQTAADILVTLGACVDLSVP